MPSTIPPFALSGYHVMFLVESLYFDTTVPTVVSIMEASAEIEKLEKAFCEDAIQNYTTFLVCMDTHTVTEVCNTEVYNLIRSNLAEGE